MKIRIVCYEDINTWICGKIARRLTEALRQLGHVVELANTPDSKADVNHHIIYLNYQGATAGLHTLMVTHIDDALKLKRLQLGLQTARAGICMSRHGVQLLMNAGLDRECLQYAHIAHDGVSKRRKTAIGISTRLYPDGRKGEQDLVRLLPHLPSSMYRFEIIGFGWAPIVRQMTTMGFEVNHVEEFNYDTYIEMLSRLDYFLYLGADEGSAAFVDALAAGVKTIVKPQGFHLDAPGGITHAFNDFGELKTAFEIISKEREQLTNAVCAWTWENYAKKHLTLWESCLGGRSIWESEDNLPEEAQKGATGLRLRLWRNYFLNRARMVLNMRNDYECGSRYWNWRKARTEKRK
jgi:hypothetical protein